MNRETIIEMPTVTLWYHPDVKIVHHELRRYPGVEALEAVLMKGLEVLRTRGARKWLSDDRLGGALPKAHHEWGQKVWGPQAAAAGWRYWAPLLPTEMIGSANIRRLVAIYAELGVTVKTFDQPEAAMQWLASQPG